MTATVKPGIDSGEISTKKSTRREAGRIMEREAVEGNGEEGSGGE